MATKIVRQADCVLSEGHAIGYRLSESFTEGKRLYSLSLQELWQGEEESCLFDDFTDDPIEAEALFLLFVEGEVTAATAEGVWEDFLYTPSV